MSSCLLEEGRSPNVPMWPAIDRDSFNVALRIEATACKRATQLFADVVLKRREGGFEQFGTTRLVLLMLRQTDIRLARRARQMHQDRLRWRHRAAIPADGHVFIQREIGEVAGRRVDPQERPVLLDELRQVRRGEHEDRQARVEGHLEPLRRRIAGARLLQARDGVRGVLEQASL